MGGRDAPRPLIPFEYLAAAVVALLIGAVIYALRSSHSGGTARPARAAQTVGPGVSASARPSRSAPTSDPRGVALLQRLRQAYVHVPAVVITGALGTMSVRFTSILHNGKVLAVGFTGRNGDQTTALVAHEGGPTYARESGGAPRAQGCPLIDEGGNHSRWSGPEGARSVVPRHRATAWRARSARTWRCRRRRARGDLRTRAGRNADPFTRKNARTCPWRCPEPGRNNPNSAHLRATKTLQPRTKRSPRGQW
jgi:hypothetical protein